MNRNARAAAAAIGDLFAGQVLRVDKARVTAVNAGPPPTVDLLIEDRWPVEDVECPDDYTSRVVDDPVMVLTYGTGRRIVLFRIDT